MTADMKMNLLLLLIIPCYVHCQQSTKTLYGLPPLPEDEDLLQTRRTTTTVKPLIQRVFPHHFFTMHPPLNMGTLPPINPYLINPVPELPPMAEDRMDGHYNDDGDFVPNKKPEEDKQIKENRIHGVKTESLSQPNPLFPQPRHSTTGLFTQPQNDDSHSRAYSRVRGVHLVTVAPKYYPEAYTRLINSQTEQQLEGRQQQNRPKNDRQWQTTAVKVSSNQRKIQEPTLGSSVEDIDAAPTKSTQKNRIHAGPRTAAFRDKLLSVFGVVTPAPRVIQTSTLSVGALGRSAAPSIPAPTAKLYADGRGIGLDKTVRPQKAKAKRPQQQQQFRDPPNRFHPKPQNPRPQTFAQQPVARPRHIPEKTPRPQQILHNPRALPLTQAHPLPQLLNIQPHVLPPQPYGRSPEDAAFLAEVEDYDWRLHYKQQAFGQGLPRANALAGFRRVNGRPQLPSDPQRISDYEDIEAIRNRESFTDNPPQKGFTVPAGVATSTQPSEVLVPFANAQRHLSSSNLNTGASSQPLPAGANHGQSPYGQNSQFNVFQQPAPAAQHPLFGGLFNIFNLPQQPNAGGFLFPGLGR